MAAKQKKPAAAPKSARRGPKKAEGAPLGRPAYEPDEKTRAQVSRMAGLGIKHDIVAQIVGVSDETLRKYYKSELATATARMVAQVGNSLFNKAVSDRPDAVNAAKHFLNARGGAAWSENHALKLPFGDPDGGEGGGGGDHHGGFEIRLVPAKNGKPDTD